MRLGIQLLKNVSSVNSFDVTRQLSLSRGETFDLFFRLVDLDQGGLRYIPGSGADVFVEIPQFPEAYPTINNVRDVRDDSIRRNAVGAYPEDRSMWKLPLLAEDTAVMTTTSIRVTVTDGSEVKIAKLDLAIIVDPEEKGF